MITKEMVCKAYTMMEEGKLLKESALIIKCSPEKLSLKLREYGFKIIKNQFLKPMHNKIKTDDKLIVALYKSGISENKISKQLKISRGVIRLRLIENKIHIRTQSEAEKLKWSNMNDEQRKNQVANAHKSVKGKLCHLYKNGLSQTSEYKIKKAQNRRALKKYNGGSITLNDVKIIKEKYNHCYWCNKKLKDNEKILDHYDPLFKGGAHSIENIVISCHKCNASKGAKDPIEFANKKGLLF